MCLNLNLFLGYISKMIWSEENEELPVLSPETR
jgi:hypothetical protein